MRALLLTLALSAPVSAQVVKNNDTAESFPTLQAAIDDADTMDGHTLEMEVADHTTPELQIVFTKDLTLQGASGNILRPSTDTGTSGDARGWFLMPLGTTVTFRDLVLDGSGIRVHTALRNHGTLTVEDCEFTEIKFDESGPLYGGIGISHFASGTAPMIVRDCIFSEIGRIGLHIFEPATIERVRYTGKGFGDFLDYFSCVDSFGASLGIATFIDCIVCGNRGVASSDGSTSAGILVTTFFGLGTVVDMTGCVLTDNTVGVAMGFNSAEASAFSISDSAIFGNDFGVVNTSATTSMTAVDNWWGDASGPADLAGASEADNPPCFSSSFTPALDVINSDGAGNSVTNANVDYCPWTPVAPASKLVLTIADCQDDVDVAAGYQVAVELTMLDLMAAPAGFAAFVEYDAGRFSYEGTLSSYTFSPYPLHISPIVQGDDGLLELDGSVAFGEVGTCLDAPLATLVFTVITLDCTTPGGIGFELGGTFPSEFSFEGSPLATTLVDPLAYTLDDTNPVIATNANITQPADAEVGDGCVSAVVMFSAPLATDNCTVSPSVVCVPASGSTFAVGITTVTCTATDDCGNTSMSTFDVEVSATNLVTVTVDLPGVTGPVTRCIHFVTDDCGSTADVSILFTGAAPATATVDIEVPCGVYNFICAKDEQHTLWDTSSVALAGTKYVAATTLGLQGGDTDNDGDVDINDVTLFLTQFGELASAGGCPWDGITRDSDFSNNGAVASEDYVFLTANWLTTSACACALTYPGGRWVQGGLASSRPADGLSRAIDFNNDGKIDYRDVAIFEKRAGLPSSLSEQMKRKR